jgi:hypothetical protein
MKNVAFKIAFFFTAMPALEATRLGGPSEVSRRRAKLCCCCLSHEMVFEADRKSAFS